MNNKFLTLFKKSLNVLGNIFAILWAVLTIIVFVFLIHRLLNPESRSISNADLKQYGVISFIFLMIFGISKVVVYSISKRLDR